jgi:hypothetical protein
MIIGIGTQGSRYGYGTNGAWITVELGLWLFTSCH